jgi:hypothetical protein
MPPADRDTVMTERMTEQRSAERRAEDRRPVAQRTMAMPVLRVPHLRLGALVALGLAAFLIGWQTVDHPVYWAGPKDGYTYELTQTTNGFVYVRYLPEGTDAGDPRSQFLTIGTYPRQGAFAELQRAAKANGAVSLKIGDDGLAVFSEARPTSVYFGYPDARYQVEVYDPSADEARRLALSGQVVPVE